MDLNRVTEFYQPTSLATMPKWEEGFAWLAGGTWLFSEPQPSVRALIDLDTLLWSALQVLPEGLEIASTCKIAELEAFRVPSEWEAASLIPHCCQALLASFKIWNTASVGGNICLSLPAGAMISMAAALEGVALRLSLISERLGGTSPVIGSGGGLDASPAWRQMIANALNRELQFAGESEITARGVAILALSALDKTPLSAYPPKITATVKPQPEAVAKLRAARDLQQALYHKFYTESGAAS